MIFERKQFDRRWEVHIPQMNYAEEDRIRCICEIIPSDVLSIADIGAGEGWVASSLGKTRPEIEMIGLDWSISAMKQFPTKAVVAMSDALPFFDRAFDLVTCCDCLEHLPNGVYERTIHEIKRISSKFVVINTPINEIFNGLDRSTCKCPKCKNIFHSDHHVRYFSEKDYEGLLLPEYELVEKVYGGWDIRFFIKLPLSLAGTIQWGWRPTLICPFCGNDGFPNPQWQRRLRWTVSILDYAITRPFRKRLTRKSEMIALFKRVTKQ